MSGDGSGSKSDPDSDLDSIEELDRFRRMVAELGAAITAMGGGPGEPDPEDDPIGAWPRWPM